MGRFLLGVVFAALTAGALACTSSQTSTALTAPTSAKCQVQLASTATSFTADGGAGTLAVTTTRDCAWSVSTSVNWVAIANTSGQGEASIPYTVAVNPVPVSRAADITVSDATLQVSQAAAPCRYSLSSQGTGVGSSGGTFAVDLTTIGGCTWTAQSDAAWLIVTSGASGSGNGTIRMSVDANSGAARVGHIQAGGQLYTVSQGAGPSPAPSPTPSPTPTPTPPPPSPPPPSPVQLSGSISGLAGQCPAVSFTVSSTKVTTNSTTSFVDGKCSDLRNGHSVSVTGLVQTDKSVLATIVDQKP
jgi:Domain of unknown function (DUF5666)/Viral BACON domain